MKQFKTLCCVMADFITIGATRQLHQLLAVHFLFALKYVCVYLLCNRNTSSHIDWRVPLCSALLRAGGSHYCEFYWDKPVSVSSTTTQHQNLIMVHMMHTVLHTLTHSTHKPYKHTHVDTHMLTHHNCYNGRANIVRDGLSLYMCIINQQE